MKKLKTFAVALFLTMALTAMPARAGDTPIIINGGFVGDTPIIINGGFVGDTPIIINGGFISTLLSFIA